MNIYITGANSRVTSKLEVAINKFILKVMASPLTETSTVRETF